MDRDRAPKEMIPLFDYKQGGCVYLGSIICQNRLAVATWSYAFEKYPPKTIIEIGTGTGSFISLLGINAKRIGAVIQTFDKHYVPLVNDLPITLHHANCFEVEDEIEDLILNPGRTYLLCDGGDKIKEFNTFAKYLKSEDIIAAHDYVINKEWWGWSEIKEQDVANTVAEQNLKSFMYDEFAMAGWIAFIK